MSYSYAVGQYIKKGLRFSNIVLSAAKDHMIANKLPYIYILVIILVLTVVARIWDIGWLVVIAKILVLALLLDLILGCAKLIWD